MTGIEPVSELVVQHESTVRSDRFGLNDDARNDHETHHHRV